MNTVAKRSRIVNPEDYKKRMVVGIVLGFMFDAIDFMVLAVAIPLLMQDWGLSLVSAGLLGTSTVLGAAFGAYIWGPLSDRFGRKYIIALCIGFFSIMSFICGLAQNWEQLMAMRFIAGLALGGEWVVGATLVAEFFPPRQRARAGMAIHMSWPVGYAIVVGVNYLFAPLYGWRVLFFFGTSGLIATIYFLIFIPESPVWLKSKENLRLGVQSVSTNIAQAAKWTDIFKGANLKVTILSASLCICILISYWGTSAWIPAFLSYERGLDIKSFTGFLLSQQVANVIGYPIFGWIGDKLGRRPNFIIGGIASGIAVILFTLAPTPGLIFVSGVFLYLVGGFWGSLPGTISEQFSTAIRGFGTSFCYATGRLAAALAPFLIGGLGTKFSLAFALGLMAVFYFGIAFFAYFMKESSDTIVVD